MSFLSQKVLQENMDFFKGTFLEQCLAHGKQAKKKLAMLGVMLLLKSLSLQEASIIDFL